MVSSEPPQSSYLRIVNAAKKSQHPDGSFGSNDDPLMKPCFTAQTIEALGRVGLESRMLSMGVEKSAFSASLRNAINWLLSQQQANGQWGKISGTHVKPFAPFSMLASRAATAHCASYFLDQRECRCRLADRSSFWFGPGMIGAALELFNTIRDLGYATRAQESIWNYQSRDGSFSNNQSKARTIAPTEWHTAAALCGLRSSGSEREPDKVSQAYQWLRDAQDRDSGCWCPGHPQITCYVTRQAIMALALEDGPHCPAAVRGSKWFVEEWDKVPKSKTHYDGFACYRYNTSGGVMWSAELHGHPADPGCSGVLT